MPRVARVLGYGGAMALVLTVTDVRCLLATSGTSWAIAEFVEMIEVVTMGMASGAIPALSAATMSGNNCTTTALGVVPTVFGLRHPT